MFSKLIEPAVQLVGLGTEVESDPVNFSKLLMSQNWSKTELNCSKLFDSKNLSRFYKIVRFK